MTRPELYQFATAIFAGLSVVILTAIGRSFLGVRKDLRRFMQEHMWLLATTLWNRDNVIRIMTALDMPMSSEPPHDLPWRDG